MGLFSRRRGAADNGGDAAAQKAFKQGQREFDAGRFRAAAAVFRDVVAMAPDSPNSQFLLGASLFKVGDFSAAIEPLRRCVAMRPEHAEAHLVLGMSLGRLDHFDEADEHLARAAFLGDEQARRILPTAGAEYCRRCGGVARFADAEPTADIVVAGPGLGLACDSCRTVLCGTCVSGGESGPMRFVCPECDGRLRVLTR
jgi:Flp pilus assembly protein TadD